jgi:phenylpropionate dioxygenase-like ring-hydroxylating dioxygenase large terminal subunit
LVVFTYLSDDAPPLRPSTSEISHNDWQVLSRYWYPVAVEGNVKSTPLKAKLLDVELVIYRVEDRVAVALDVCPHRFVRLSAGQIVNERLVCSFHGLEFNAAGQCTRIPALGRDAKIPPKYRLRTVRTEARYGLVWVCLDEHSAETVPVFEKAIEVGIDRLGFGPERDWPVAAPLQIENYLDIAHLPFVHQATLTGDKSAAVEIPTVEHLDGRMVVRAKSEHLSDGEVVSFGYLNTVYLPFSVFTIGTPSASTWYTYQMWNIAAPTSARECRVYSVFIMEEPTGIRESRPAPYNGDAINLEDIVVLSAMARPEYPLSEKGQVHIPGDNISHEYRKRLSALGLGGRER